MFNYFKQALLALLLIVVSALCSKAEIVLVNNESSSNGQLSTFTQSAIDTPPGSRSDFEIIACTTSSTGANFFLDPTPARFSLLSSESCGSSQQAPIGTCALGIWDRQVQSQASDQNFCNWNDPTEVFAGASFRWAGVDPDNPIVDLECETGAGAVAMAPSADAEEGSEVLRVFNFGVNFDQEMFDSTQVENGVVKVLEIVQQGPLFQAVLLKALSFPNAAAGPTGTLDLNLPAEVNDPTATALWRACTITLMPEPHNIPTLSEWGLGVFAALTGIAAVWALRRRAGKARI